MRNLNVSGQRITRNALMKTYKNPKIVSLVVDIDDVLNAGHCVDPFSEMQLSCAIADGATARIDNSAAVLALKGAVRCFCCFRLGRVELEVEQSLCCPRPPANVIGLELADSKPGVVKLLALSDGASCVVYSLSLRA